MKTKINVDKFLLLDLRNILILGLVYYIAGMFVFTGTGKILGYSAYSFYINNLDYLPGFVRDFLLIVPFLEVICGLAIFVGFTRKIGLSVAVLHFVLMTIFWIIFYIQFDTVDYWAYFGDYLKILSKSGHIIFSLLMLATSILTLTYQFKRRKVL